MTTHVTPPALAALRTRFEELYGNPPPSAMRAAILTAAIAWQEQVLVHGDVEPALARDLAIVARELSEVRRGRAGTPRGPGPSGVAAGAATKASAGVRDISIPPPLPPASSQLRPGARLVRAYAGVTYVVEVTADGFLHAGQLYGSLSAVAKAITGTHWNGLLFFGLRRRRTAGGSTSAKRKRDDAPAKVGARG